MSVPVTGGTEAERAAFVEFFPEHARSTAAVFGLTPEDLGFPSTDEDLKDYAGRYWDMRRRDDATMRQCLESVEVEL